MVKFFKDCLIRRSKKNKKQKIRDSVGIMKKKQGAALPLPVAKQNKPYTRRLGDNKESKSFALTRCDSSKPRALLSVNSIAFVIFDSAIEGEGGMFIYKINLSDQPSSSPKLIPYFQSPVCNYSTFVTIGTKLFCIGGVWEGRKKFYKDFGVSECSPVVVSLDTRVVTSDRHWIRLRRMHLPRRCPKVVVIDSKIYVFGGINVSSSCSGFAHFVKCWAEVYDPKFNTWARLRTSTHQSLFSSLSPSGATFPFIIATFSHQKILIVTCGGRELTKTFLYDIVSGLLEPKDVFESGGVFNRFSPPYHPGPALTLGNSIYTVDWLRGTVQGYSLVSSRWTNTKHQFISNHEYDVEDNRARNHILVSAHNVSPPSTVVDPGLGDGGDQLHILYMVRGPYGSRSRYIYHKKMEVSHDHMGGTLTLSNLSCPTVYSIRSGWRCAILGACCLLDN